MNSETNLVPEWRVSGWPLRVVKMNIIRSREMLLGMLKPFARSLIRNCPLVRYHPTVRTLSLARTVSLARSYAIVHPFVCYLPFTCSSQQSGRVPCWGAGESLDGEEQESNLWGNR